MKDLSIIIPSFNTKEITQQCLRLLLNGLKKEKDLSWEVIVVDNGSRDGSAQMLAEINKVDKRLRVIANKKNLGYPKANNQGVKKAEGRYVLFLNSDVFIKRIKFKQLVNYLDRNKKIGVIVVRVELADGRVDPASHRGFPTLWNAFCYFTGLESLLAKVKPLSKIFGGYHLKHLDLEKIHEIDSPSGAFYLTRKDVLDKVGGFDEAFFMYGEDLDLSFRIKSLGYKIVYYPRYVVTHLKYLSGLASKNKKTRRKVRVYFYKAMEIFYRKHYSQKYPQLLNKIVYLLIKLKIRFL